MSNRVFLIDGHAQIFRSYYAFMRKPMVNSKNEDTSILYGFTKMLLELLSKEHPTHLAVAFDPPCATFRHIKYPQYKANRTAAPELVKAALDPLQEILKAFGIPVVMINGFEADDTIGSMAIQWGGTNPDSQIYMVTPDKDYGQLIRHNIFQYKPAKGDSQQEILGPEQVCEKYGIQRPEQVIDILTLWGDSSDNVPGVNGIGEKGAGKLISQYGSVESILEHINELSERQRKSFQEAADHIDLSKFLVTIKTDIELPLTLEDIRLRPFNGRAITEVLDRWEFPSLKKLLPENLDLQADTGTAVVQVVDPSAMLAVRKLGREEFLESVLKHRRLALGLVSKEAEAPAALDLFAAAEEDSSTGDGNGIILASEDGIYEPSAVKDEEIKAVLEDASIVKAGCQLKDCIKYLWKNGVDLNGCMASGRLEGAEDVEIMHYLVNAERSHKFNELGKIYLSFDYDAAVEAYLAQDGHKAEDLNGVKEHLMLGIAAGIMRDLKEHHQDDLYYRIEMPLIAVLAYMEAGGVKIDNAALAQYSRELSAELAGIEKEAREMADDANINLSSPKQVGILLFEKLKLDPKAKKSAKGSYTTDEAALTAIADRHPIVGKILEYRALKKLLSTYIDVLPGLADPSDGKVHTTFNQTITATGRLSSVNPNLQNIPVRTERGKEIRKAFVSSFKGGCIVSADYSQIELRLMAHISGDENMIAAFNSGEDIHRETAARIFAKPLEEVTREERSKAKTANFGIIYGISTFGLSQRLGMSRTDSKKLIEDYFASYSGVKEYISSIVEKARANGYVQTIYGRRRYLPDINSRNAVVRAFSERNAVNAPLQGSAADIIKLAMINVFSRLVKAGLKSRMVLQVHDELIFDVAPGEEQAIMDIARSCMESVAVLKVPLTAECSAAENWLLAH